MWILNRLILFLSQNLVDGIKSYGICVGVKGFEFGYGRAQSEQKYVKSDHKFGIRPHEIRIFLATVRIMKSWL